MAKVNSLGLDMGNRTICAVGQTSKGLIKEYMNSIYTLADTSLINADVIETNGTKLTLGAGSTSLTNIDKTNREYVDHQILWAVNKIYGHGEQNIKLCVGLPINLYKSKKDSYIKELSKIKKIKGTVNCKNITVYINDVDVKAEGYAAIKPLGKYINKNVQTLIIDVGMKTTDCILVEWDGNKFRIVNYDTINIALYDIYKVLQEQIAMEGIEISVEEIDRLFSNDHMTIRTEKGDYNIQDHLKDASPICRDILKAAEIKFGKLVMYDKAFIGGGAEKLLQAFKGNIKNTIDIPQELRYYANAIGYFKSIK